MTPQYIMRKSLCREPWCAREDNWQRTALSIIDNLQYAHEYAEPGYTNPRKAILFADWNYFSGEVCDILERAGYSIEWQDEWATCDDCGKALRTQPNDHMWEPSYQIIGDHGIICNACHDLMWKEDES